ncbi:MAG: hypothetical protein LBC09_01855 [Helicobacteraceae bacterium]|jgi:hypothetical protein|nr:hypothetical protein [Helicobacteraceae bacterium]
MKNSELAKGVKMRDETKSFRFLRVVCAAALSFAFAFAGEKKCEDTVFSEEDSYYMSGYSCFYPNQTLAQAYKDIRLSLLKRDPDDEGYKNLRAKLEIGKNREDRFKSSIISIDYVWKGNKTLDIELFYAGGTTNLWLSQKDNGVETTVTFNAD